MNEENLSLAKMLAGIEVSGVRAAHRNSQLSRIQEKMQGFRSSLSPPGCCQLGESNMESSNSESSADTARRTRSLNAPSPIQQFGPCGRILKNQAMVIRPSSNQEEYSASDSEPTHREAESLDKMVLMEERRRSVGMTAASGPYRYLKICYDWLRGLLRMLLSVDLLSVCCPQELLMKEEQQGQRN